MEFHIYPQIYYHQLMAVSQGVDLNIGQQQKQCLDSRNIRHLDKVRGR